MKIEKFSISDIDCEIYNFKNVLSSLPRFNPERAEWLIILAGRRHEHFELSDSNEQLDQSILHLTEAILLLPKTGPTSSISVASLFLRLACSLHLRWLKCNQPDDIKYCVKYLRYFRAQRLQVFDSPRDLTLLFVMALTDQVESMSDNAMEIIKEMTTLCRELLNSDSPPIEAFIFLTEAVFANFRITGEIQDQVIECLREANTRFPDSLKLLRKLADCLTLRFFKSFTNDDYEEAMGIQDKILTSASDLPEDIRNRLEELNLEKIASLSYFRYKTLRKPEYLEDAIFHIRAFLNSTPPDHRDRPRFIQCLANLAIGRVSQFGIGIQDERFRDQNTVDLSSLSSLTASLTEPNSSIPHEQWGQHFRLLSTIEGITENAENKEMIKYCRLLVASVRRDPSYKNGSRSAFTTLGIVLFRAFMSTDKIEYLDESIAVLRDGLKAHGAGFYHHLPAIHLISSLGSRFLLLRRKDDLDETIQLLITVVNDAYLTVPQRFQLSCLWVDMAHDYAHSSITVACEQALSLMQDSLSYAPTLELQHFRLVEMRDLYEKLPTNFASYHIDTGQVDKAIETLERGRCLLWSEIRGFRTSTDKLAAVDPALEAAFVAINRDLEQVIMSMEPCKNIETEGSDVEDPCGTDSLGHLVVKQQKLLKERDKLISRIRALPGFGSFLDPISFDALRSAALHGPVIIINHCERRSGILILLHDSPPSLIMTTEHFYDSAIKLSDRLVKARKHHRLESTQYQRTLRSVLESLYELVGKPVMEEFHKMKIPEQSRVWWCPTSVFCHLPLHAMGPIPSDDGVRHYFSDLYIPSYTPTLSALIESRRPGGQTSCNPSVLLVAQPESLPHAFPEIWIVQGLNTTVTSLISKRATPSNVVEGLRHHHFSHFVCHGNLEPGKPFDASFELYGGLRLTLIDIARSQLPTAEFAFLSACHTAELTEESIADEALHLTAAMQYCGFRSVVGTMWAMADEDGQHLVEEFYKLILSSDEAVPYYKRSARALRDAVKNLRRRGASLERWVNYVHYGA